LPRSAGRQAAIVDSAPFGGIQTDAGRFYESARKDIGWTRSLDNPVPWINMSVALGMGAIEDAALARLASQSPCPDRVQAARVRYYPDVNVELVDVLRSRTIAVNYEGTIGADETFTDYRLRTVLRGKPSGASTNVRHSTSISSPTQSGEGTVNPVPPVLWAGIALQRFDLRLAASCPPLYQPYLRCRALFPFQSTAKTELPGFLCKS
jgi:hypothetical protein